VEEIRVKLTEGQVQDIYFHNIRDISYQISISTDDVRSFMEICKFVGLEPRDYSSRLLMLGNLEFDGKKFIFEI